MIIIDYLTLTEALEYDLLPEDAIKFDNPNFNTAIIGISEDGRLIYDYDLMVEQFMKDNNCDELEAVEFIDYNTMRALPYAGEMKPIILMTRIKNV